MFNKFIIKTEENFGKFFAKRRWLFFLIFTLLIVGFNWELFVDINKTATGDFDYFAQVYEAIRRTILDYHQFPWVNSWVGGGVPLYANPQVGVFSIQTVLVLLFGTIPGLKISLILYSLVGFWSFYLLAKSTLKTSTLVAVCLGVVWITNGFFMSHYIGHYTFSLFQIFPLLCYLALNITKRRYWLYLSITLSLLALSALHYAVLQSLLVLLIIAVSDLIKNRDNWRVRLVLYFKAMILFLVICLHRIIYTMDYVLDFPRSINDPTNGVGVLLKAFIIPKDPSKWFYGAIIKQPVEAGPLQPYGWGEINAFVGYAIVIAFIALVVSILYIKKSGERKNSLYLLALPALFFVIAIGSFAIWSPYSLIHMLPGFSGMRVSSRWLIWVIFFILIFIGYSLRHAPSKTLINIVKTLIVLGAIEVFAVNLPLNNLFTIDVSQIRSSTAQFEQFDNYDHFNQPKNLASYHQRPTLDRKYESYGLEATANNYGEVRGYEPLLDSRFTQTLRCGVTMGCDFILSNNAKLTEWSPNEITLKRTNQEPIELNMNPSNYWLVNGKRIFASQKVGEVEEKFIIKDKAEVIVLRAQPKTISQIIIQKIGNIFSRLKKVIRNHFL